ncbi:signal peptidase II [Humibacter sp.]|uniref:signal peptidase II n=1 Tax=Humibacter sp. TaxID=1940291 RepID=UPI003F80AA54
MEAKPSRKVSVRAIILLVAVALVVLTIDQLAKWWVVTNLPYRVPKNIIGNLLIFEYDRNPGAAFSIGTGSTWIFSIVAVAVLIFVIWYARRIRSMVWAFVFGLVLGGLLGNLSDRLFRPPGFGVGEVVDFLRIPLLPAIFNLADSAIVAAMILFLLLTVLGVGLDGRRSAKATASAGEAESAAAETPAASSSTPGDGGAGRSTAAASDATKGTPSDDTAGQSEDASGTDATDGGDTRERAESRGVRLGEVGHSVDGRA